MWETTDAFHEAWKLKSRDMLARAEWRRRKLTKRVSSVCVYVYTEEAIAARALPGAAQAGYL